MLNKSYEETSSNFQPFTRKFLALDLSMQTIRSKSSAVHRVNGISKVFVRAKFLSLADSKTWDSFQRVQSISDAIKFLSFKIPTF